MKHTPVLPIVAALLMIEAGCVPKPYEEIVPRIADPMATVFAAGRPIYPGGADVECAMAIAVAKHGIRGKDGNFDPVLRDEDHGDLDCELAFKSAGVGYRLFDNDPEADGAPPAHLTLSRPLLTKDGRAVVWWDFKRGHFVNGSGFFVRVTPEGIRIDDDPLSEYIS